MAAGVEVKVNTAKVGFVSKSNKGPARFGINWYRKDKRDDEWKRSSATVVAFGDVPTISKGDRVTLTGNALNEESNDWKMGKPGDKESVRPATFLTILCNGEDIEVTKGERKHKKKESNPFPQTDHDEDDLPF